MKALEAALWTGFGPQERKTKVASPDPVIEVIVKAQIREHQRNANPARSLASKYGSRTGNWFVMYRGEPWPMKALYCAVMEAQGKVYGDSPAVFHSGVAKTFFLDTGFDVVSRSVLSNAMPLNRKQAEALLSQVGMETKIGAKSVFSNYTDFYICNNGSMRAAGRTGRVGDIVLDSDDVPDGWHKAVAPYLSR